MQVYWVQNAISLKEEHYNNSVRIAMKSVINRLLEIHNEKVISQINTETPCFDNKNFPTRPHFVKSARLADKDRNSLHESWNKL